MKTILIFAFFYFGLLFNGYSQLSNVKLLEVKNENLVTLLASLDTVITKNNGNCGIYIYVFANASGSAHVAETDEITNKVLVATTNGDELPEQHLFKLGDFYDPKISDIRTLPTGGYSFSLVYTANNHKKKLLYVVSLRMVTVKQAQFK
ncbi:hypothetical protein ACFGVR_19025 [Mucilaginibacter sp. AW1-3]